MSSNTNTAPAVTARAAVAAVAAPASSLISGTSAAETLGGTAGADEIFGYGQNDLINAGDGHDTLWGGAGNDTLNGGAGDDLLIGESGDDRLDGGLGSDTYRVTGNAAAGFSGYDTYADTGTSGTDRLVVVDAGGTGPVDIGIKGWSGTGIEQIDATGTTGTVRLLDTGDANLIDLRTTTLTGSNLLIDGNYGDDTIYGSAAADTIVASFGNDVVDGGEGGDTYRISGNEAAGWGVFQNYDTYKDTGTTGTDRIVVAGTTTGAVDIGIKGWSATGIEQIDATGTTGVVRLLDTGDANLIDLRTTTLTGGNLVVDASYGNDTVYGSAAADTIVGGSGNDLLDGGAGGDTYRVTGTEAGGWSSFHGFDTYADTGTSGTDKIVALGTDVDVGFLGSFGPGSGIEAIDASGATGTVRLYGEGSSSTLDFRNVTVTGSNVVIDSSYGNDTVYGTAGADTILVSYGDDVLDGAGGSDTYRVSGNATTAFQGFDTYKDSGTAGTDRIVVTGGTLAVDIGIKGWSATGIEQIDATGTTGAVRLLDTYDANLIDLRTTTLTGSNLVIDASFGNDTVYGSAGADTLVAGGGNDVVDGGAGGDTYRVTGNEAGGWSSFQNFDAYADTGTSGTDRIVALGTGDVDIGLLGNFGAASGIEAIDATGATGTVRIYGDGSSSTLDFRGVTVTGSNAVIDSNYGNDTVYGTAGADTILTSYGDDVLDGAGGGDTFRVTGNTTAAFQGYDLYADSGTSGTDKIVVAGADVDIGVKGWSATGIEQIDATGATGAVRLIGTNGAELFDLRTTTLTGSNLVIDAGWGNDTVYGSAGNDTIANNQGDDVLDGAGGSDTFRVTGNLLAGFQGYDTYVDSGTSGTDKIVALGTGDVDIGTRGWNGTGIETIDATGAAGTVRLVSTNASDVFDLRTTTLVGSNIVLDAGWGNDTVFGSAGNDMIANNQGDDLMDGAGGSDTFRVSGNTTLDFQGYDTYKDSGTAGTDRIVVTGGTLAVDIGLKGWSATGIEQVDATGTTGVVRLLDTGDANLLDFRTTTLTGSNLVIDAGYGNDTIYGSAAADTILAGSGNDVLDGSAGGDTYRVTGNEAGGWSSFHGFDTYADTGTSGTDRIVALGAGNVDIGLLGNFGPSSGIEAVDGTGASGTVRLYGDGSATTLDFRAVTVTGANVVIDSNYGNDTVYGTAGADTILTSYGDDVLDGAGGGDTFRVTGNTTTGFQGYDTYQDSGTSGTDKIVAVGTGDVDIGLQGNFGAANGIEVIDATGATGTVRLLGESGAQTLDFRSVTLTGTRLLIDAGNGNDVVYGSAGDDTLVSNNGEDTVDGAGGSDTYRVSGNTTTGFHGYDTYKDSGTAGADRIVVTGGTLAVDIGLKGWSATGIEQVDATGTTGVVRLLDTGDANLLDFRTTTLTGSNLVIDAGYGNDTIYGSAAADTILAGSGNDVLDGGAGGDTYRVTGNEAGGWSSFQNFDTYADTGTTGTDKIVALGTGDVDIGLLGNFGATNGIEVIDATGATGTVRLYGDGSNSTLDFRSVTLTGSNIVIDGAYGHDVLYGSAQDNVIVSGWGDDTVDGFGGSDTYRITGNTTTGFQGYDTYADSGTSGTDKIVAVGTGDVDIGFKGNFGPASGIEVIDATGATGTVRLLGESGAQTLDFRSVTLTGTRLLIDAGNGNDVVYGSAGNDTLVSNNGEDTVDGAGGSDTYRVSGNTTSGFHGYDTYQDSGTSGTDTIAAVGTGDVDIGLQGNFGAANGIEAVDATGATGTVRLLGDNAATTLDFRSVALTGTRLVIDAGNGNDVVYGSAGNDTLVSNNGEDTVDGAGGSDTYRVSGNTTTGFHGYDTYKDSGTAGTDRIVVTGGTLAVDIGLKGWSATGIEQVDATGTTGVVRLLDTNDANLLDFRTTTLTGSNLVIDAGYGNDTIYGSAAADTILAGSGNDVLDGGAGGDTYRVTGNEAGGWSSFQNFDTYADTGTTGTDKIVALGTGDVDIGLLGNFGAGSGIEAVDGTGASGTVRLYGDGSATTLDFRAVTVTGANVVIDSNYGNDTVYGTAGADTILTSYGDDVLDGAGGGDTFRVTGNTTTAFQGYDTYQDSGTSGIDKIVAVGTGDVDIGFKGNFGPASGIEVIDATGATGTVRLLGESGAQTLDFRSVTLTGTRLLIDAGNGNDVVYGSAGNDTLVSNNGEDTVDGAGGSDTYRVSGNTTTGFHGYDTYQDSGTSGTDTIAAVGTGDVDIGLQGNFGAANGIEAVDATGATGTVRLLGDNAATTLDFRSVALTGTRLVIDAGNGNDTVYGSAGNDTLLSNYGDDVVDGAGGSDTYRVTGNLAAGFQGRDTFKDSGTSGTDTVVAIGAANVDIGVIDWQNTGIEVVDGTGATGTVRIWASDTANLLDFSATTFVGSNIVIDGAYGSDTIKGSAGNDVIIGGADTDLLDGQNGSDTYRVTGTRAAGWNSFQHFDTYADTGTTGTDKIVALGTGDVDIGVAGWQNTGIEVVDGTGATGMVRLLGRDEADVMDFRGTTLVGANLVIDGGYSNDTIFGSAGADTIVGAGNDDRIDGFDGGDTFRVTGNYAGGWSSFQGFDTYSDTGTAGVDRLVALGGTVDIGLASWQNTGVEVIDATGATGTVRLLGGDDATLFDFRTTTLAGSNLLIDGAWGSDTLIGSAGADQLVGGGGDDSLDGFDGSDTYQVTGNLAEGWRSFQGFDTYQDTGTTGIDTIHAQGAGDVDIGLFSFDASSGIEVIDTRDVVGQTRLVGSWSDDVLDFSSTSILGSRVVIDGSGGTDVIFGSAGNDTIIGGSGADSMAGGAGNDVYRVGRGASLDVIWDYDETAGNQDVVEFGPDIAIDQLWFKRLDGFLEVSVIGSWDRVYVMDWDTGPASQIEQFRTADGHVLLNTQVDTLINAMAAFDAPSGGTTTLPANYRDVLVPVITSTWS